NAMNVEGLSEATVEKMIDRGFIHELADLFHLERYKEEIIEMEGFGEKSYSNMQHSIEKARNVTLAKFIYSLGIANVGLSTAKLICTTMHNEVNKVLSATKEQLVAIDGIGEVIADTYIAFMKKKENQRLIQDLLEEITITDDGMGKTETNHNMDGLTFVITGSLNEFTNRKAMQEYIEQRGGKVTGSVSSKTNYLINNDNMSASTKNKKAKELEIPILTEAEFLERFS
ncbi:MAG: NAD-dependent DNA ligase LigA, partial [Lachnospiraceae bacterium]|nr:NAD-dependent DNA ligase LigA [Lachnospiraceae bacterium]